MVNAERIEKAVVNKVKDSVLTPKILRELLDLTKAEFKKQLSDLEQEVKILISQAETKRKKCITSLRLWN